MTLTQPVADGIHKFIRLIGFRADPLVGKWTRDEFDLIEALEVTQQYFHETAPMLGLKMYKGQDFDAVEDVKRDVEEYLLTGREQKDFAAQRRRNLTMYHLIVEPTIDSFKGMDHQSILDNVDDYIQAIIDQLCTADVAITYDDAVVTRAQVHQMIREREAKRKAEIFRRRKVGKTRRKAPKLTLEDEIVVSSTETFDLNMLL